MVITGSDRTTRRRGIRRQRDPSVRFGAELRQAREQQGLSLETIQDRTGVRRFHLEALEEESLSPFPDEKTALVAVRRFAEVVGLDGAAMMQIVGEQWRTVGESPPSALVGVTTAPAPAPRRAAPAPVVIPAPVTSTVAAVGPAGGSAHLSRFPGDTSHLKAFTQTAQVPQVGPRPVHPTLPPGLRFDNTDSIPVTQRYHDPFPAPIALQVAIWSTVLLLGLGVVGLAVHHWRPAWLAKIHLISSPGGGGTGSTKPSSSSPTAPASIAKTTGTGPLSANVAVHASTYQVVVVTQAPCWIHVSSPTSSTPVFSSTVPAGTTKTFTSGNGQLSVELGASHATVTVQILGKTAPGWSLTPTSAPYVVNFSSTTG
ncbi:MAG TPA: RodZ domain-containing protein [Acidimicrobiales bacterium]